MRFSPIYQNIYSILFHYINFVAFVLACKIAHRRFVFSQRHSVNGISDNRGFIISLWITVVISGKSSLNV